VLTQFTAAEVCFRPQAALRIFGLNVSIGLISAIRPFDLLAPNQPFGHALERRQTGKAIAKYSDLREPEAVLCKRLVFSKGMQWYLVARTSQQQYQLKLP
jgi:hypothetical protein